ncbi:MAG: DUF1574 domain-containing protein [Leptospirales bacterium]|nr:DUF1574 domain-containing protein [Leptospirales bacterium]
MDYLRSPYLLYPLMFSAALLLLDKLFLLPEVRDCFLQPGGMVYYRQRQGMLETLPEKLRPSAGAGVAVVFGDSRSFAVSNWSLYATGDHRLSVYNFAGPQANLAYHAYLAERIFQGPLRPEILWLGLSPDAFNRNGFLFGDPVLKFGVDSTFVDQYRSEIPAPDLEVYESSRRFALPGMNFSFRALVRRLRGELQGEARYSPLVAQAQAGALMQGWQIPESQRAAFADAVFRPQRDSLEDYCYATNPERIRLDGANGAQFNWFGQADDKKLREESERLRKLYLNHFLVSQEQFFYFSKVLRRARQSGARIVVFWPRVNPYLQKAYAGEPAIAAVWRRVVQMTEAAGGAALNLNETGAMRCNLFYDASHMSYSCFPEVSALLLAHTPH